MIHQLWIILYDTLVEIQPTPWIRGPNYLGSYDLEGAFLEPGQFIRYCNQTVVKSASFYGYDINNLEFDELTI